MATVRTVHLGYYVDGLPQFIRELDSGPDRLRRADKAFYARAARLVRDWAQENARKEGGVAAKSQVDIRLGKPGEINYGGKPYNMGAEFGSYQYRQFDTWRGKGDDAGYFLWPAIRRFRDTAMTDLWLNEAFDILRDIFTAK